MQFGYNGFGLRAWKQPATNPSQRHYYVYDGSLPLLDFNYDGASTLSTYGANGLAATNYSGHGIVAPYVTYRGFDPSGNLAVAVQPAYSTPVSIFASDAFGKRLAIGGPAFAGQWGATSDSETNLVLMGHRYYDPNTGRFLTRHPIGYNGGINLYAYCKNNPANWVDPLGLCGDTEAYGDTWDDLKQSLAATADGLNPFGNPLGEMGYYDSTDPWNRFSVGAGTLATGSMLAAGAVAGFGALNAAMAGASAAPQAQQSLSSEGQALTEAEPVGSALKSDMFHQAATFMRDEAAQNGTHFHTVGSDGPPYTLTQVPGGINGNPGRFEYMVDSFGQLTHQRFVLGGTINGKPNVP